jgi:serine/threonine protein kinase
MSPEIWRNRELCRQGLPMPPFDAHAADVFALGVSLLTMLRGNYPFMSSTTERAMHDGAALARSDALVALLHAEVEQLVVAGAASQECARVLRACTAAEPGARPTAAQLLEDAWFIAGQPYPQPVRDC